jgi:hypothetical protein
MQRQRTFSVLPPAIDDDDDDDDDVRPCLRAALIAAIDSETSLADRNAPSDTILGKQRRKNNSST